MDINGLTYKYTVFVGNYGRIRFFPTFVVRYQGELSEWLKEPASKTGVRQRTGGSNPSLTAPKRLLSQALFALSEGFRASRESYNPPAPPGEKGKVPLPLLRSYPLCRPSASKQYTSRLTALRPFGSQNSPAETSHLRWRFALREGFHPLYPAAPRVSSRVQRMDL